MRSTHSLQDRQTRLIAVRALQTLQQAKAMVLNYTEMEAKVHEGEPLFAMLVLLHGPDAFLGEPQPRTGTPGELRRL